jgi:hypothetical protein
MQLTPFGALLLMVGATVSLQAATHKAPRTPQAIFIEPQDGFESYISAAFFKKRVPAAIVTDKQNATLILKSGSIATQEEKSGLGKLARCAYALCVGIDGSQTVSVELMDRAGQIVWAYSVRKMGAESYQSSAEAIAKHLRDFLEKQQKEGR